MYEQWLDKDQKEKFIRDAKKGQSLRMLCYLYKLSEWQILILANRWKLIIYDPRNIDHKNSIPHAVMFDKRVVYFNEVRQVYARTF